MNELPVGYYKGKALRAEFGVAKTGTEQVLVEFEITEGEHAGKRIFWYGFYSEASAKRTTESLRHCGCTFPSGYPDDVTGLGDKEVSLDVQSEVYDGKQRTKVAWVNALGGASLAQKMDDAQRASFRERMKGTVLATAGGPSVSKAPNGSTGAVPTSQPQAAAGGAGERPF